MKCNQQIFPNFNHDSLTFFFFGWKKTTEYIDFCQLIYSFQKRFPWSESEAKATNCDTNKTFQSFTTPFLFEGCLLLLIWKLVLSLLWLTAAPPCECMVMWSRLLLKTGETSPPAGCVLSMRTFYRRMSHWTLVSLSFPCCQQKLSSLFSPGQCTTVRNMASSWRSWMHESGITTARSRRCVTITSRDSSTPSQSCLKCEGRPRNLR